MIGTPMFILIPAVLKAYIDQIVRVGVTVRPDDVALLTGKKATIILASGGDFNQGRRSDTTRPAAISARSWPGLGIKDAEIILAGRARAGATGETAVEQFGAPVRLAAAGALAPAVAADSAMSSCSERKSVSAGIGFIGRWNCDQDVWTSPDQCWPRDYHINSRGPETLAGLVADLGPGATAGTKSMRPKRRVILATNWVNVPEALKTLTGIDGFSSMDERAYGPKPDISLAMA